MHILKENGRRIIGDGHSIDIKEGLPNGQKAELVDGCALSKFHELIDPLNHSWDTTALRGALPSHSAIEAMKSPIGWRDKKDKFFWPHNKEGIYSVKSGYWCLSNDSVDTSSNPSSSYCHSEEAWANLWRVKVQEKSSISYGV